MFTVESRGLLYDTSKQPPHERIAYFTALCPLASGAWLCGCQNGPGKHAVTSTIALHRSTDNGRTWQRLSTRFESVIDGVPGSLAGAELVEARPGRLLLFATWFNRSDPARPLFDPETEGILKSKQLLAVSTDDGQTWSDWREIDTGELRGCAMTGPPLRWDDGAIAFAFESFKEYDDPRPGRHAAWLMLSRDEGATFSTPLLVAQHPAHQIYYWDQRLCVGREADAFTALFWTHDLQHQRDLTVHLRHGRVRGERLELEQIRTTSIPGQIAAPLWLDDGRLLAFVVDRDRPGTMTLWCSSDRGETWPTDQRLVIHVHDERAALTQGKEHVDFKQYWEDMGRWSFGHPALRQIADGRILFSAWYAGTPDCMSLHWARIAIRR